jgi:hypothetical protein
MSSIVSANALANLRAIEGREIHVNAEFPNYTFITGKKDDKPVCTNIIHTSDECNVEFFCSASTTSNFYVHSLTGVTQEFIDYGMNFVWFPRFLNPNTPGAFKIMCEASFLEKPYIALATLEKLIVEPSLPIALKVHEQLSPKLMEKGDAPTAETMVEFFTRVRDEIQKRVDTVDILEGNKIKALGGCVPFCLFSEQFEKQKTLVVLFIRSLVLSFGQPLLLNHFVEHQFIVMEVTKFEDKRIWGNMFDVNKVDPKTVTQDALDTIFAFVNKDLLAKHVDAALTDLKTLMEPKKTEDPPLNEQVFGVIITHLKGVPAAEQVPKLLELMSRVMAILFPTVGAKRTLSGTV